MKPVLIAVMLGALCVVLSACEKKQDPAAELEKAAAALATEETAPAQAEPTAAPENQGAGNTAPAQQVRDAMAEYKAGKMEDAVTRLQILRQSAALSPQQRMALQDSIAAVMAEVYVLAEKGDARAIAAVAQYQRLQNAR